MRSGSSSNIRRREQEGRDNNSGNNGEIDDGKGAVDCSKNRSDQDIDQDSDKSDSPQSAK